MTDPDVAAYLEHTPVSDPGPHAALLDRIEPDIRALPARIAALMIHPAVAAMRSLPLTPEQNRDRQRRTVSSLLDNLMARDGGPLDRPRALPDKLGGVCRDHAMLGVAALRHHGVPARMRGGFSRYFEPDFWDDHWVVEVWREGAWRLVDTQLGPEAVASSRIGFDPWDVPRDAFVTSPEAWLAVRRGEVDTGRLGVGRIRLTGAWFAGASVVRDAAALAGVELLPWDYWAGADDLTNRRDRLAVYAGDLDAIAGRLAGDGATFANARAVLVDHEWIGVPRTVTSYHGIGEPGFEEVRLPAAPGPARPEAPPAS